MVQITKENGMQSAGVPFAWVEVQYPDKAQWDETGCPACLAASQS